MATGYQFTRPDAEQVRFTSSKTGSHALDLYMEDAEKGGRTLAALMGDVFNEFGERLEYVVPQEVIEARAIGDEIAANRIAAADSEDAAKLSEIAAESARDSSLIQAGVYVDEPTGRAAVANGEAFKVQGTGLVAAIEYRRVDASSSTLLTSYPSVAAYTSLVDEVEASQALLNQEVGVATEQAGLSAGSAAAADASRIFASKINLGAKSSPPTVDNQGAALLSGANYYDTSLVQLRVWNGSAWAQGIASVAGVESLNGQQGALVTKTVNGSSILGSGNLAVGDVTLAGAQTLTNKTITETVFALTGTTPAFTATNGAVQTWTLTAASTPTNSLTSGQSIILVITPGSFAITWPGATWTKIGGSGALPALFTAGKTTVVLWMVGGNLYGSHLGDTA
jgi:hypothetical protein